MTYIPGSGGHVPDITEIPGLSTALAAKVEMTAVETAVVAKADASALAGKANASHTHVVADIIGLGGGDPWTWLKLALDSVNSTVTPANVTGLSFTAALGTYLVEAVLPFQTAATTTGIALDLDVPVGSQVYGLGLHAATATTLGAFEQIADAATTGASTGVRAANTTTLLVARWLVIATVGTVQLQMRSEVAASAATLKAGGALGYRVI